MTTEYVGPERRANPVTRGEIIQLTEQVRRLAEQTRKMNNALSTISHIQERQQELDEAQRKLAEESVTREEIAERDRRRRARFIGAILTSVIVVLAVAVAVGALWHTNRRERHDFVQLRNAAVDSCKARGKESGAQLELYRKLELIIGDSTPKSREAVAALKKAEQTQPGPGLCRQLQGIGG